MFNDLTSVSLDTALAGLSTRQRVIANNIANLETPGFSAQHVNFEDSLADAINEGHPADAEIQAVDTGDRPGQNGNNVNLEREFTNATKTGLQQKLLTGTITARFGRIATVLKG
jgi:flagellar basal-body rod protein FlgB